MNEEELCERICKLEKELLKENYISKDKIKEKIEKIEMTIDEINKNNNSFWTDYTIVLDKQKEVLKELLEDTNE